MTTSRRQRRFRLWNCLESVCEMESRLEEKGRAELFRTDFRFLRGSLDRVSLMSCRERELQRLERSIQVLLLELGELLESGSSEDCACWGRH